MHPRLQRVVEQFAAGEARLGWLAERVPHEGWLRRPEPTRWSLAECIAHLNLTARA